MHILSGSINTSRRARCKDARHEFFLDIWVLYPSHLLRAGEKKNDYDIVDTQSVSSLSNALPSVTGSAVVVTAAFARLVTPRATPQKLGVPGSH